MLGIFHSKNLGKYQKFSAMDSIIVLKLYFSFKIGKNVKFEFKIHDFF